MVAYQLAAAVGEDRWTAHPTCALLLVAAGREPPDETALWEHAAKDRGVAVAGGIRRVHRGANLDDGAGLAGEVSADAPGKRVLSGRCVLAGGETGSFRCRSEDRGPKPAETLAASGRPVYPGVGSGESKRKSWLRALAETKSFSGLPEERKSVIQTRLHHGMEGIRLILVVLCANMHRRADPIKHSVLVATINLGLSVQFNLPLAFLYIDRSVKSGQL